MSGETTGAQDVPERPASEKPDTAGGAVDGAEQERDRENDGGDGRTIGSVSATRGARRTRSVERLVLEAKMVAEDDWRPDNPSVPVSVEIGEAFRERIDDTELVPAWTRPWEQDGGDADV